MKLHELEGDIISALDLEMPMLGLSGGDVERVKDLVRAKFAEHREAHHPPNPSATFQDSKRDRLKRVAENLEYLNDRFPE